MNTDNNNQAAATAETEAGEGESNSDVVTISKAEWEKTNQTLGSLKRELKDYKKPKEETKETSTTNQTPDNALLQKLEKMSLRQAGIDHPEDIELARKTAEKWKVDIDDVISDDDFKTKLERQRTGRANVVATSNVRGTAGTSQAKSTPEYYVARGTPPTREEIPNGPARRKVAAAFLKAMGNNSGGKKFYND